MSLYFLSFSPKDECALRRIFFIFYLTSMSFEDAITQKIKKAPEAGPTRIVEKQLEQRAAEERPLASPETVQKVSRIQARVSALFDQNNWRPETGGELQELFAEVQYLDDLEPESAKRLLGQVSGLRKKVEAHFQECQSARREIERLSGRQSGRQAPTGSTGSVGSGGWWKKIFGK